MLGWFKRRRRRRKPEFAALPAVAPVGAAAAEEPAEGMRIGRPDGAWTLLSRYADDADFLGGAGDAVTAAGYAIHLDLTAWVRTPPRPAWRRPSPQPPDAEVTVVLPKARLMGLTLGLLNLSEDQLANLGWSVDDRLELTNPLIASTRGAEDFELAPEFMAPTLKRSSWLRILKVLEVWRPRSARQGELRTALRALIGAELDRAAAAA